MLRQEHLRRLRAIDGAIVLGPNDDGYDDARRSFNGLLDRRPAVIVQPITTAGVASAVRVAAEADLPIAVRGGGHSVAGHSVADGALVVDLRRMRTVTVDTVRRIARAGGGATWHDLDGATVPFDLATTGGVLGDTGVGGLALGGGIGYLMGTCGLSCDNILGAEVVLADGSIVWAGEDGDHELRWGLRGGGGNFGVVTTFEFRLHEIPEIYGGRIFVEAASAPAVVPLVLEMSQTAPPELVLIPTISAPDNAVDVALCYRGPAAKAERMLEGIRRFPIVRDGARPCTYLDVQAAYKLIEFGRRHWWKGYFVHDLDAMTVDAMVEAFVAGEQRGDILIEPIVGMARSEPADGASFGQRAARYNVTALAIWDDPAEDGDQIAWARRSAALFEPAGLNGGSYVNYDTEVTNDRVLRAYGPERYERLARLKARVDPDNRFRFNHNIEPAVTSG
jgi:FAD/FMN-containing dehydrogenase